MDHLVPPRLYAILDLDATAAAGLDPVTVLDAWLGAGVTLVQLRAKRLAAGPFLDMAQAMSERLRGAGGTFIVNDHADIARSSASGLHIGQEDLDPIEARRTVGVSAVLGLSTHTPAELAAALAMPVDYLAVGPIFQSLTKQQAHAPIGMSGVRSARAATRGSELPLVAIGGITLANAAGVIAAGAASVAVISDLLNGEPGARAAALLSALR